MSGIEIRITGKLRDKTMGVNQNTGKQYFRGEVVFEGGKETLYFDDGEAFGQLPDKGEPVVILAEGERDYKNNIRLNNCRVHQQAARPRVAA